MVRTIAIAGLTAAMLLGLGAQAQEAIPELDGGPGSHPAPLAAPKLTLPETQAAALAAKQSRAAAAKLKADQARLAKQAADLKAQQAKLDARAAQLAAEEKRLAKLRADQEADHAARLAEIARQKKTVDQQTAALQAAQKAAQKASQKAPLKAADKAKAAAPQLAQQTAPSSHPQTPSSPLQAKTQTQTADATPSTANHLESRAPEAKAAAETGAPIDITRPAPPVVAEAPPAIEPPVAKAPVAKAPALAEAPPALDAPVAPAQSPAQSDRRSERRAYANRDDAEDGAEDEAPRTVAAHLDLDAARRSCARAGEDAALARRYYSARYDDAVRVYQDGGWKLSGRMRLEDRRGYLLIDTICEVDEDGQAQRFSFLRR